MADSGRNEAFTEEDIEKELGFFENSYSGVTDSDDSTFGKDLLPGEKIIITAEGRSGKGTLHENAFTIFWLLFVTVWMSMALMDKDGFAALFGIPHTIMGVMLLFKSGFIRTKVTIAVTDKRVLIRTMGKTQAVYLEKARGAMILPSNRDDCWNITLEGIKDFFGIDNNNSENKGVMIELSREDAVKIADIIDRIIKGEYI